MSFFKKEHKLIACKNPSTYLTKKYEKSEDRLKYYARVGDQKKLKKAMKEHGKIEYAMLYQHTPEFKQLKGRCR